MRIRLLAAAIAFAGAAVGCAHTSVIQERLTAVEAPLRAAEEMGAQRVPRAALHMQYAKDQLAAAEKLDDAGRDRRAQLMLMRAQADAELALALVREANADGSAAPPPLMPPAP